MMWKASACVKIKIFMLHVQKGSSRNLVNMLMHGNKVDSTWIRVDH